jgi:hypothetical protein
MFVRTEENHRKAIRLKFGSRKSGHEPVYHSVCYSDSQSSFRACSNKVIGAGGTISGFYEQEKWHFKAISD